MDESERLKVSKVVELYSKSKSKKNTDDASIGFIRKNRVIGKSIKEVDSMISTAKKLNNGELKGAGDLFSEWCSRMGRPIPSDDLVSLMNKDPFNAKQYIVDTISESPLIYKAYCSYTAGRGRRRV